MLIAIAEAKEKRSRFIKRGRELILLNIYVLCHIYGKMSYSLNIVNDCLGGLGCFPFECGDCCLFIVSCCVLWNCVLV